MQKQLSVIFAVSLLFSTAHAGSILFNTDASGTLTSVTLNTTYTLTSDLSYRTIQIRILDAYPLAFDTRSTSNFGTGFTLSVSGGTTYYLNENIAVSSQAISTDGGSNNYDVIFYFTNTDYEAMSLSSGQTVTISGTAAVTGQGTTAFITPTGSDYSSFLASGHDGSRLSDVGTETLTSEAVPEPSTYAALAGLGALALAFLRRRKA